jgi:hypothetical protein
MDGRDSAELHRLAIDNAITHLLWHEEIRQQSGLAGVSQIWGEEPAWYFWLRGMPGAFLLQMGSCDELKGGSLATYLLHYFPVVAADPEDQAVLEGSWFDRCTGTPRYEHRHKISSRFLAGETGVAIDEDGKPLTAYISWRQGEPAGGEFFSLLISALVFFHRRRPEAVYDGQAEAGVDSRFVVFDKEFFSGFISRMTGHRLSLTLAIPGNLPDLWAALPDIPALCTAAGTCGCAHP